MAEVPDQPAHLPRLLYLSSLVGALACGASGPSQPAAAIAGHFAIRNPWVAASGFAMGRSLKTSGTNVTGTGWLGGLENPLAPLTVSGQFTDPDFILTLTGRTGSSQGTITGSATASSVTGSYERGPGTTPIAVVLIREDTGATGLHTTTLTGAASEQRTGAAGFGDSGSSFVVILEYPERNFPITVLAREGGRPLAGTYPLGGISEWTGNVVPAYAPDQKFYIVTSGSLRIDVSTPFALIGQITLQGKEEASGAVVNLTASFSAGCATPTCL